MLGEKDGVNVPTDILRAERVLTADGAARTTVRVYVAPPATTIVNTVFPTFIKVAAHAEPDATATPLIVIVSLVVVAVTVRVGVSYDVYGISTVYASTLTLKAGVNAPAAVLVKFDSGILV